MITQKPLPQRRFKLQELIETMYKFDYFTAYSDDHRVYTDGLKREAELKNDIDSLNLTQDEKELIIRVLGYRFTANYLESTEFYDCTVSDGLWSQNCQTRPMVEHFLGMVGG